MRALTAPRERPILFAAAMVRAILDGRKTQTRRVMKPQPPMGWWTDSPEATREARLDDGRWLVDRCPHGQPGDRLWVRETWGIATRPCPTRGCYDGVEYRGDELPGQELAMRHCIPDDVDVAAIRSGWRPSIFMPRWASRLSLEVTAVRVQRLQDISEDDAKAEGVAPGEAGDADLGGSARGAFYRLWDDINGTPSPMLDDDGKPVLDDNERPIMHAPKTWSNNPWVWAITFSRVT